MTHQLTTKTNNDILTVGLSGKDSHSQLSRYAAWLEASGNIWYEVDLDAYRDELLTTLKPSSVQAHLSTIRSQYRRILRDNATRDNMFNSLPDDMSMSDKKAFVDELVLRIKNALEGGKVTVTKIQDQADSEQIRLTPEQANRLMRQPSTDTLKGLRDTSILALMLATGIREQELCNLEVDDLRQRYDGELALMIRDGKGSKQRMVPYGDSDDVLTVVDAWLKQAGITSGLVFRGFNRKSKVKLTGKMSTRSIQRLIKSYPIIIDGTSTHVKPHDLRRTYARRQYDAGLDVTALQQNLGHQNISTTLTYIGTLDAPQRRAKDVFDFHFELPLL